MPISVKNFVDVDNTVLHMQQVILKHFRDPELRVFDNWPLQKIYDYISKTIPYVRDPIPGQVAHLGPENAVEALKAPVQTMYHGGDCDDKTILAACIFERKKIPYTIEVVSTQPDKSLHHVYLRVFYNGKWQPFDATYSSYKIFTEKPYTKKKRYIWNGRSLNIYEVPPVVMKNPSYNSRSNCVKCSIAGNCNRAYLNGNSNGALNGVKLVLLEGAGDCNCGGPCCSSKTKKNSADKKAIARGSMQLLGFDPITAAGTVVSLVSGLFGGLFAKERYQDAYNVWEAAAKSGPGAAAAKDWQALGVNTAVVAVLGVDYMNPPWGADVCTSPNRCGNRAEWSKIQPAVEAKVIDCAPFFVYFCNKKQGGFSMEEIYSMYKDFKNKGALYNEFLTATKVKTKSNSGPNVQQSSFSGAGILLLAGAAAAAYMLIGKSKKYRK